jgi:hypothetical protein
MTRGEEVFRRDLKIVEPTQNVWWHPNCGVVIPLAVGGVENLNSATDLTARRHLIRASE